MPNSKISLVSALLSVLVVAGCEQQSQTADTAVTPNEAQIAQEPVATAQPQAPDEMLSGDMNKYSYVIGVQIGQSLAAQSFTIDQDALAQGVTDVVNRSELKLTMAEMEQAIATVQAQEQQRHMELAAQNLAAGEAFLAENRKNADVTETASGLQYKILTQGTGTQPKATDSVVVHYRGTLVDGTEFDSSYSRGEPITISLEQVIPGWQEAVSLMPTGSKWQVFIPSNLGYGENGTGTIGPNSALVFEVELLSIAGAPAP